MRDGSVSYSSVLEAICSYCSSVSLCRQCRNVFALKGNLATHMKTPVGCSSVLEAIRSVCSCNMSNVEIYWLNSYFFWHVALHFRCISKLQKWIRFVQ